MIEPRGQSGGQALWFSRVDREQTKGFDEFTQVVPGRGDHDEQAVRSQDPVELRGRPRGEDIEYHLGRGGRDREAAPDVGADGKCPVVGAGGPAQRRFRDVDSQAMAGTVGVEDRGEVVSGAGSDVNHQALGGRGYGRDDRPGHRAEVPGCGQVDSGRDHFRGVTRMGDLAATKIHISLAGQVEAVAGRAPEGTFCDLQRLVTARAPKVGRDVGIWTLQAGVHVPTIGSDPQVGRTLWSHRFAG